MPDDVALAELARLNPEAGHRPYYTMLGVAVARRRQKTSISDRVSLSATRDEFGLAAELGI